MESFIKKRNKWLPKIQEWVNSHGGGIIIPFSVEFEERLWSLREDPVSNGSSGGSGGGARGR